VTLLDEVLDAHGGLDRWRSAREIRARAHSGGFLPRTRFRGNALADYKLRIEVDEPHAILEPFPGPGRRGVFAGDTVRIDDEQGRVLETRDDPRAHFFGRRGLRRNLRWDPLDTTYFAGYAMWNYMTTPYLLTRPGVEVNEGEEWSEDGESWRRLEVDFPAGLATHSAHQTFYVDEGGLIRRQDYTAEVVARIAHAAHYCDDHKDFDGLVFPTTRRVYPRRRDNRPRGRPTIVWIDLEEVRVLGA
jgi:hypothetical protein